MALVQWCSGIVSSSLAGGVLQGIFIKAERVTESVETLLSSDILESCPACRWHGGDSVREADTIHVGSSLLVETLSIFCMVFLAFGVALDPLHETLFGLTLGPVAVGCSWGLLASPVLDWFRAVTKPQ